MRLILLLSTWKTLYHGGAAELLRECASIPFNSNRAQRSIAFLCWCVQAAQQFNSAARFSSQTRAYTKPCIYLHPLPLSGEHTNINAARKMEKTKLSRQKDELRAQGVRAAFIAIMHRRPIIEPV